MIGRNNSLHGHSMKSPHDKLRKLKVITVGDGTVGKTCLLTSYTETPFPEETYATTVFDIYTKNINVDGREYNLSLHDTTGQKEYERLRPLLYPNTDCFILCYSLDDPNSFANVESYWIPELKCHCPNATVILVGTKSDLIDPDDKTSEQEAEKMRSKINANNFVLCSAKTREGVHEVFVEAVRSVVEQSCSNNRKTCSLQ